MKSIRDLLTNINFVLRLLELVICLLGIIYYHHTLGTNQLLILHGWFSIAFSYILSYIWETPDHWVEVFAIGVYVVLMAITIFTDLTLHSILPATLAALLVADLAFVVVTKAS
ncbi:hypothetical protein M0802_006299 [Mischocyttarus mexicanus]|nr:hypothetical protein M0802_006299 [Mischocyttarus mexicanus]